MSAFRNTILGADPGYADLPPGVGFAPKDEPLRRDIDLLGRVLGRVIVEQEGEGLLGTEEEIRALCKRLRFRYEPDLDERLRGRIERMKPWELGRIVRAFSVYFQLVNVAERYHRIRRGRQYDAAENGPQRASVKSALGKLARGEEEGAGSWESLGRVLDGMDLSLVLTAHPTETLRVRVRRKHFRVAKILDRLDQNRLTPREKATAEEELAEEITLLWQTDELRAQRPDVEGEIHRTLTFFEDSLIEATLEVYRRFEDELRHLFPEDRASLGPVMRFGSWVGGDQDGNPYVKSETMLTALRLQRDLIINRHRDTALRAVSRPASDAVHSASGGIGGAPGLAGEGREATPRSCAFLHGRGKKRALPPEDAPRGRALEAHPRR